MVESADSRHVFSKRKAISTLLPHAIFLEQDGQQGMIDTIFRAARASQSTEFMWHRVVRYISRLFEKRSPSSLDRVIILAAPYLPWRSVLNSTTAVSRWVTAVLAIQYTDEIGESVVDALFDIVRVEFLRPHIPIDVWRLLKRRPPLPPAYREAMLSHPGTIQCIQRFGDVEILKSYFLVVWLDRVFPDLDMFNEMLNSIREDFGGVGMGGHRRDLIERLDSVLGQLNQQLEFPQQYTSQLNQSSLRKAHKRYAQLRDMLLEFGRE